MQKEKERQQQYTERQIEMEKKLYSRNFTKCGFDLNPFVSFTTGILVLVFIVYAVVANAGLFGLAPSDETLQNMRQWVVSNTDWVFVFAVNFFIALSVFLAFSKLGRVRLGGMKAKPEFSNFAWYSMLISAGMGIGLMFWAVGEPLTHAQEGTPIFGGVDSYVSALASTFLHWGFHAWAIYAIMALSLAHFAYNKKLPLSLRSIFYPIFKERVFGRLGDIIDLVAVLATLFGLATSLGLGVQQINSGLGHLTGITVSPLMQVVLIIVITAVAAISIISGIDKGVKKLSKTNMKLAFGFMLAILILGPTLFIFRLFASSFGTYLADLPAASFFLSLAEGSERDWQGAWTIFYLAWWISWSPFVGMFIARVSKGRTIREFIIASLFIPSLLSFVWLSVFAGAAFEIDAGNGGLYALVGDNLPGALFELLNMLDVALFQGVVSVLLTLLATGIIIFFFITSSDSGSIVVNAITSGGKTSTKSRQRVFWAVIEGAIASVLIIIGGQRALETLQDAVILTGLPFALVLMAMSVLLLRSLQKTYRRQKSLKEERKFQSLFEATDVTHCHD